MNGPVVSLDGVLLEATAAVVPATDVGVRAGLGVFTTLRATAGRAHRVAAHSARVVRDAGVVGLPVPQDAEVAVARAIAATVEANRPVLGDDLVVRVTITATGDDLASPFPGPPPTDVRIVVTAQPRPATAGDALRAATVEGRRSHPAVKSTSYLAESLARRTAGAAGADEGLFVAGEELLEGAGTNLVLLRDGQVWTPPADGRILPGTTRAAVLAAARRLGLPVVEAPVTLADLQTAEETALTSAVRGVVGLVGLDGRALPGLGPLLRTLRDAEEADDRPVGPGSARQTRQA